MERRKGRPLRHGSLIAVPTPASPLVDLSYLHSGVAWLEEQGFRVRLTPNANVGPSFKAGVPEVRARDLHEAFLDPEVDAICPLAGGHAGPQILSHLDYELIAAHPKPFIAFSELTALHVPLVERAGLVTFYGAMVSAVGVLPEFTRASWLHALTTTEPIGRVDPGGPTARTIVPGVAEGELVGGVLSVLASLCGTPWQVDARGKVLLIEDVNEEPPRIDRYLTQLIDAGVLEQAAGLWFGDFKRCVPREPWPLFEGENLSVEEILAELIPPLGIPAMHGLRIGHQREVVTVPFGVRARMDATAGTLELLEPALVPRP